MMIHSAQTSIGMRTGLDFSISVPLPTNSYPSPTRRSEKKWLGIWFIAFPHQITVLSRKLIQEVQPVLPIKGGRTHETERDCQRKQNPSALAQGQVREGEVSRGAETW